ncbi:MAG: hypothetical protein ACR2PZ_06770 [Pseudomonadales bacterium]
MNNTWLEQAIGNNVQWCAAVGRAQGVASEIQPRAWISKRPMPLLYPNLITLKPIAEIDDELQQLQGQLPSGWGIKDSFSSLQITDRGFKVAFDAHWYVRAPEAVWPGGLENDDVVFVVETSLELDEWTFAWGRSQGNATFPAPLLSDPGIDFVFVRRAGEVVAGLVANLSDQVVGVSNGFGAAADLLGCIQSLAQRYPNRAIVGYGSSLELATLETVGFTALGDLRVWLSSA